MHARAIALQELRRGAPYALVLALGLGAVVAAGAQLSNASPSQSAPFGWKGPADLEHAVAMVRMDLILAASLPALMLGARAMRGRDPADSILAAPIVYATHAILLAAGVALASGIAAWGSFRAPFDALLAFWTAHTALTLSFYSIAFAWDCYLREHALAAAFATWIAFESVYESVTRTILFRTMGYDNLVNGIFPAWFWVSQALSPITLYRGILILWRPAFRDYTEQAALKGATLPGWLVPATFVGAAAALFMLLPLAIGMLGWWLRTKEILWPWASRARAPS